MLVEAALQYQEKGWSVIPCNEDKKSLVMWAEYQTNKAGPEQIRNWWNKWPNANVGVLLGNVSNLTRIDVDGSDAETQLNGFGDVNDALSFTTPSGGRGYLYQHCAGLFSKVLWSGEKEHEELRLQSRGAYTILPPSEGYEWTKYGDTPPAPEWLRTLFTRYAEEAVRAELGYDPLTKVIDRDEVLDALKCIPADNRDIWLKVGMALHSMNDDTLLEVWDQWSQTCVEKYKENECSALWSGFDARGGITDATLTGLAWRHGWISKYGKYEPITDVGNARVLSRLSTGNILHCDAWEWIAWTGCKWSTEGAWKIVQELQKEVLNLRLTRARDSVNRYMSTGYDTTLNQEVAKPLFNEKLKQKRGVIQKILSHQHEGRIRGARILAASIPGLSCDHKRFNTHPTLLNCPNGTLDLESGMLRNHVKLDYLTQLCNTQYMPNAECPRWERFMLEVFGGDMELVLWFQRLLGYCLTGDISHHVLSVLHGTGRNGKSTVVETICSVLGEDYATVAPQKFLTVTRGETHPTKLVVLYGKRFVVDSETGDGARLDEELVKKLTGGDTIQARRMYENFWEFKPTHKLILITNHEPTVEGTDEAIWGRVRKIPFKECFLGREEFDLRKKLLFEAAGILRWMVDGCKLWFKEGFGPLPSAVTVATASYRSEQNTMLRFFEERLAKDIASSIQKHLVISAYSSWCSANRVRQASNKAFGEQLRKWCPEMDVAQKVYKGIKLI
jgi:P4 family phage/plasmid primase-like protien